MTEHWGPPPGELFVDRSRDPDGEIVLAALRAGNVVVMVQPPRGFGENPIAIYHDPDLPPSHHYLAAYRWLRARSSARTPWCTSASTATWSGCPARTPGMSAACGTDAALGDLPLVYPFLVNDPGEGTQAKRRAHATLIDHLVPPMARAESYGDIARLEQLLDEHAQIAAMDPAKLPAIRAQIWTLIQAAKLDHDLGLDDRPDDAEFDDFLLHVDGWLCEIKDAQIRDGLHVLGAAPAGADRVNLVLAILRARQMWGGQAQRAARPARGARASRALRRPRPAPTRSRRRPARWSRRWRRPAGTRRRSPPCIDGGARDATEAVAAVLAFAATEVVPRLAGTTDEIDPDPARAGRRLRPGRAERVAAARPGQRAADRPQLLLRRPAGGALPAGLGDRPGDGRLAAGALPGRHRRLPAIGRPVGVGHRGDAHLRRRHRRGARPARRPAGLGRGLAPGQRRWSRSRSPNSAGPGST